MTGPDDTHSPLLAACLKLADEVEQHAAALGTDWDAYPLVLRTTESFRRASIELATRRGLDRTTIAFTGPKDAGKTRLLSSLIRNPSKREQLPVGFASADATDKVTWLGPQPPTDLHTEFEEYIPCTDDDLEPVGFRYALVDVPGLNEAREQRRSAANRALDSALLKVLVVDQRTLEDRAIGEYLSHSDGATIIPIINFIRTPENQYDFDSFRETLRKELPNATIRPLVTIPDFETSSDATQAAEDAHREVIHAVIAAGEAQGAAIRPENELTRKLVQFKNEISDIVASRLPATREALENLSAAETALPGQIVDQLLGSESVLAAGVRQKLRATLLERTPYFLFPWRTALSIANLVHGATDRIPLALAGSIPSLVTTAFAAVRNVRDARAFSDEVENGIRERTENAVRQEIRPQIKELQFALRAEIGNPDAHRGVSDLHVGITGLGALQTESSAIIERTIDRAAPHRITAWLLGILGTLVFWGIFGWPIFQLYYDYASASQLAATQAAHPQFPEPSASVLLTSVLLALLPMFLLLLFALTILVRGSRCRRCVAAIRQAHHDAVDRLAEAGLLTIRVDNPEIRACLHLSRLGAG